MVKNKSIDNIKRVLQEKVTQNKTTELQIIAEIIHLELKEMWFSLFTHIFHSPFQLDLNSFILGACYSVRGHCEDAAVLPECIIRVWRVAEQHGGKVTSVQRHGR